MKRTYLFNGKLSIKNSLVYLIGILVVFLFLDVSGPPQRQATVKVVIFSVRQYQRFISPGLRGIVKCKFEPSCSEYSIQSVEKYGTLRGSFKTLKRLWRCSPWNDQTGYDPP
jgi:uncharacterized protein